MNTCGFDAALLDLFLDGALSPEEMGTVQAHLDTCPDCQAYVDDVLAMREFFPDEDDVELPADFTAQVMDAVAKTPQSRPRRQPWGKLAAAAACLAVIVLVQQTTLPMSNSKPAAAPFAAPAEAAVEACADMEEPAAEEKRTLTAAASSFSAAAANDGLETAKEAPMAPATGSTVSDMGDATLLITATESEVGALPEDLTPVESAPGYACYLLKAEDPFVAVLAERGVLEERPADGITIRLEIRSE